MDRTGRGVMYASPDDCIIVGIAGRSVVGVPSASPSFVITLLQRAAKLGLCWLFPNETRPKIRRAVLCSGMSSSRADPSDPNTRLGGRAMFPTLDVLMVS